MRYPTGLENIVRDATLTATNTAASSAWELVSRVAEGGGTVELSGSYSGADDAVVDIEITSNTINGAPQLSAPVYAGIGNGSLSGLSADSGIDAQEFTITCLDLGTPTRKAWAPFQSVNLRAKVAGTAGNAYSLRVSQAGLTATATDFATTGDMSAGASEFSGDQYNFGAINLEPEGTVPTAAPRIRFGDDVTVYRHWRVFRDGAYRYHLSPALKRPVPIGTRVYAITGGRTVELLDGSSVVETFDSPPVTTLYSLLSQIAADSTLIEVDGVIAQDRRPGGMACDDLTVFTSSYSAGSTREGTSYIKRAIIPLTVPTAAPTEILRAECIAAPIPGAEIWRMSGSVSGEMDNAVSGVAWTDEGYAATIPQELAPNTEPEGEGTAYLELLSRDAATPVPSLCVKNFRLGAEAQTRTYVFEWRPRPAEACDCSTIPVVGGPNDDILGIVTPGGAAVATLPATLKTLYEQIEDWRLQSINLNCYFGADDADTALTSIMTDINAVIQADTIAPTVTYTNGAVSMLLQRASNIAKFEDADIAAIEMVANTFQTHLLAIYNEMGGSGSLDSAVAAEFQDQWDFIVDKLSPLMVTTNTGGRMWKSTAFRTFLNGDESPEALLQRYVTMALEGTRNLTNDLGPLTRLVQACIGKVYIAGNLLRPFDGATLTGNAVWQDHGGDFWFVSQGDGLLPIQPGFYYHSARMEPNDIGEDEPVSTREFGFGPAVGCVENMQVGDKLIVKTTPYANGRATYQQGDAIEWEIVRADPVQLGGGQIGNDTVTFGVRGSVAGALDPYPLVTTAPSSYSNGGLAFTITPGAIPFEVGDRWTFSAEGGEFRWRVNSGSWTTADIAATVSLSGGITARFVAGATPSWADGDVYQLKMLATSGAGRARTPSDESMAWTGSTQIDITPTGSSTADTLMLALHTIASTATVTLSGSNDNWATTAVTHAVPWASGTMALLFASATCTKWRLTVSESGSIGWLYLGVPERPIVSGTAATVEHGRWTRRARLANGQRQRALGGQVAHSDCSASSIDDLLTAIEYAHSNDDGRIGAVSPEGEGTLATVADEIDLDERNGFAPAAADRRLSITMTLTPR